MTRYPYAWRASSPCSSPSIVAGCRSRGFFLLVDSPGVPGYGLGMYISPDELTNQQLQDHMESLREHIDENRYPEGNRYWGNRIKLYEGILKERAESGEYVNH